MHLWTAFTPFHFFIDLLTQLHQPLIVQGFQIGLQPGHIAIPKVLYATAAPGGVNWTRMFRHLLSVLIFRLFGHCITILERRGGMKYLYLTITFWIAGLFCQQMIYLCAPSLKTGYSCPVASYSLFTPSPILYQICCYLIFLALTFLNRPLKTTTQIDRGANAVFQFMNLCWTYFVPLEWSILQFSRLLVFRKVRRTNTFAVEFYKFTNLIEICFSEPSFSRKVV